MGTFQIPVQQAGALHYQPTAFIIVYFTAVLSSFSGINEKQGPNKMESLCLSDGIDASLLEFLKQNLRA